MTLEQADIRARALLVCPDRIDIGTVAASAAGNEGPGLDRVRFIRGDGGTWVSAWVWVEDKPKAVSR